MQNLHHHPTINVEFPQVFLILSS